ncbi:MAG: flagellar biosynthesis protein FlhF [Candidatus Hydrogenedentes bacterium]|nr:flagellar biosynthesis protein FlhF [Candidatus Hydrogenedentota bacterium]
MERREAGLHTIRAATLDEAYRLMREQLGEKAVVVRTAQVRDRGILGWFGRQVTELTATVPRAQGEVSGRKPSAAEKRYLAGSEVGSEETVSNTIAYFQRLVSNAQQRLRAAATEGERPAMAVNESGTPIVPFRRPKANTHREVLEREIHEVREMLQVLIAETPGAGLPTEFAPHYRRFIDRGVTRKAAASLLASVAIESDLDVLRDGRVLTERLKLEIRKRLPVTGGLRLTAGVCRIVALVGATGVGKTTNLAKLAAHFAVKERARVALVTSDTYRVAAPEQLRVYANIIGLPLRVVNDAKEMVETLSTLRDHELVLVDTAGGSQFNTRQIHELEGVLSAAQPDEVMLMLSANTQLEELRSVSANFRGLKPTSLFFSKLDETQRYGALFSIAVETGLPLSYLSVGQNVPDDLILAHAGMIANLILEGRKHRGRSSTESP